MKEMVWRRAAIEIQNEDKLWLLVLWKMLPPFPMNGQHLRSAANRPQTKNLKKSIQFDGISEFMGNELGSQLVYFLLDFCSH